MNIRITSLRFGKLKGFIPPYEQSVNERLLKGQNAKSKHKILVDGESQLIISITLYHKEFKMYQMGGVQYSGPSSPASTHLSSQGAVTVWNSGLPPSNRRLLT